MRPCGLRGLAWREYQAEFVEDRRCRPASAGAGLMDEGPAYAGGAPDSGEARSGHHTLNE